MHTIFKENTGEVNKKIAFAIKVGAGRLTLVIITRLLQVLCLTRIV